VHDPSVPSPAPDLPARGRWATLVATIDAIRTTDPSRIDELVFELSAKYRWLTPLAYVAGTLAVVFDGVLILLRSWRLTLLQLVPATWIWAMSWNLRNHMFAHEKPPVSHTVIVAVVDLLVAQIAYWCNAVFAYTLAQDGPADIRAAYASAKPHWKAISGTALVTGGMSAVTWIVLPHFKLTWFWVALAGIFVLQIYLFVALPVWLLRIKKTGTRKERGLRSLTTGVLSGIASIPGFLLNRIGLLLLGIGPLWWLGIILLSIGAVIHVTASSSVRVVKMSVHLRGAGAPTDPDQVT
jgi:hypothetical protein